MNWTNWAIWGLYLRIDFIVALLLAVIYALRSYSCLVEVDDFDCALIEQRGFSADDFERFFGPNVEAYETVRLVLQHKKFYDRGKAQPYRWWKGSELVKYLLALPMLLGISFGGVSAIVQAVCAAIATSTAELPLEMTVSTLPIKVFSLPGVLLVLGGIGIPVILSLFMSMTPPRDLYPAYIESFGGDRSWLKSHQGRPWKKMAELKGAYVRYSKLAANPATRAEG